MSGDLFYAASHHPNTDPALVEKLGRKFAEAERRLTELEQRTKRLTLKCDLMMERSGLSGEQLDALVKEREKKNAEVWHCTKCGKVLLRGLAKCMYCGAIESRRPRGEV